MKIVRHQWAALPRQLSLHPAALVICGLFIALALAYNFANPPFEATDEIRHFRYVRYLALQHTLPPVSIESSKEMQAHHPPLYYTLAALLTFPISSEAGVDYHPPTNPFWGFRYYEPSFDNKNQYLHAPDESWQFSGTTLMVYMARFVSLLFGLGTVMTAYRLGQAAFQNDLLALGAMAFTAFNPMLLHGSVSVNNDAAAAFFGSWAVVESVRLTRADATPGAAVQLGVALGLGILSKASTWVLLPLAVIVYALMFSNGRRRLACQSFLLTFFIIALLSGWWFARNYLASGDPLGLSEYRSAWTGEADLARRFSEALSGLPYAWTTFWARLNYGQIVLPEVTYQIAGLVCLWALFGLLRSWRVLFTSQVLVIFLALGLSFTGWGVLMLTIPATANARLVFQIFPALGLLLVFGWSQLVPTQPRYGVWVLAVLSFGLALVALLYLARAYAYPMALAALPAEATPVSANFEGLAEIAGYRVSKESVTAGDEVEVTIYWRPLGRTAAPFQIFVHLVDPQQIITAQRDTYPGLGVAPTHQWRLGQLFADTYRIFIPEVAYAPAQLKVRVGIWNTQENRSLVVNESDAFELGVIDLQPRAWAINFSNKVILNGYEIDKRVIKAGETITVVTRWQAQNPEGANWFYLHVVGLDGRNWQVVNQPFAPALLPQVGQREIRAVKISAELPEGQYWIRVGVTSDGNRKVPILAEDGRQVGEEIYLIRIRVEK